MAPHWRIFAGLTLVLLGGLAWYMLKPPKSLSAEELSALYETPLSPPSEPLTVYHLGHSLVGRDMPAMLAQLAGHDHASQLGWGTPLRSHWYPDEPIQGFDVENAHDNFRDAKSALESGEYDVFVITEMVEIEAAIEYFDAPRYLQKWVEAARAGNPGIRTYLYETWHRLDDPQDWLNRLDTDPARYWEGVLIAQATAAQPEADPIYVIPAGRVLAEFVRRIEASGGIDGVDSREDLFARAEDGSVDTIHVNDLGAYLVALTHYAVLYHRSPEGLPAQLDRADGSPADAPGPELAALMQKTVWDVVTTLPATGIAPAP
ncbi:hypothetical protein [Marivita hallyeonensis]|uniref:Uncharacterized protein n=1 Tax=Marivita hallyeonensis TaxID=996342 RepID=A0A1M5UPY8_9RHOB|nr:hypothetical protein [Marivita hallyeonensis]SHH65142.1 hypothetical protein SAMN05443551_2749 [Marivita hallyeonensis]